MRDRRFCLTRSGRSRRYTGSSTNSFTSDLLSGTFRSTCRSRTSYRGNIGSLLRTQSTRLSARLIPPPLDDSVFGTTSSPSPVGSSVGRDLWKTCRTCDDIRSLYGRWAYRGGNGILGKGNLTRARPSFCSAVNPKSSKNFCH